MKEKISKILGPDWEIVGFANTLELRDELRAIIERKNKRGLHINWTGMKQYVFKKYGLDKSIKELQKLVS